MKVTSRARSREDRAGDPLDGLVNLFDIGIVLSVAFLLAALSSLDMTSVITDGKPIEEKTTQEAPADSVLVDPNEDVETIKVEPGQEVVGRGEPIGQLYQLDDGRTVVVKPSTGATGATGATGVTGTP
ncbi:MAG TPA: DUF2149 domain-containing protein [Solirubrobacterales bacterium]|nr:DUF2149 domain-containing protein [Solirubrobacterales bacterium]